MGPSLAAAARFYHTSIGKKYVVAITGIALLLFVFGHLAGNLVIFLGRDPLNAYGAFLHGFLHGWGVWFARIGLLGAVGLHILATVQLTKQNKAARSNAPYQYKSTVQASRASLTMILSGLTILVFVVYHLWHFTISPAPTDPGYYDAVFLEETGEKRPDVYAMVVKAFSNEAISVFYIVAVGMLCMHLSHGFASVFQTLGLRTERSWPVIMISGYAYALLIFVGNSAIPISVLMGLHPL